MKLSNKRFQSRLLRVLFHLLPRRTKRLLFLSSLSGKVVGTNRLEKAILIRLQKEFDLCGDPDAIGLPLACKDRIWGKRQVEDLVCPIYLNANCSQQALTRTARRIVVMMPCWLVYDNTLKIVSDVRDLLTKREELFSQ